MAYNREFATNKANQQLMATSNFKDMLKVVQFIKTDSEFERLDNFAIEEKIKVNTETMKYVFVIDGSKYETSITEGSNAKLCLFNINQCVVDIEKMVAYLKEPFPLPKQYQQIKEDVTLSTFLPVKGMRTTEYKDEKDFFRFCLYSVLENTTNPICEWLEKNNFPITKKETVLETYMYLLGKMDKINNVHPPCPTCRKSSRFMSLKAFKDENETWLSSIQCKCNLEPRTMYPTDFLGFHEQLNNENSNEALTTQIMLVMERLSLINLLRNIINNGHLELLDQCTFMMDGSLAIYSHASWLAEALNKEIMELKSQYSILIVGVEKTGNFVDHFKKVNDHFATEPLKHGMLFFLEDEYIKKYIKMYDNEGFYGENNYFGKKLYYKNKLGKLFVINVAFEDEHDRSSKLNDRNTQEYRDSIARLNDIVMLLDNFSSQSYENALSLISLANEGAALSSSYLGKKLLNEFVMNILKETT